MIAGLVSFGASRDLLRSSLIFPPEWPGGWPTSFGVVGAATPPSAGHPAAALSDPGTLLAMRGLAFGLVVLVGLSVTVLSLRPGGLRRQLRLAARRFRIVLVLAGAWTFGSLLIRLVFANGAISDYGPALLAVVLGIAFLVVARDPDTPGSTTGSR